MEELVGALEKLEVQATSHANSLLVKGDLSAPVFEQLALVAELLAEHLKGGDGK